MTTLINEPAPDDLDAWIDSGQRKHRTVTLYARADLMAPMDELDREINLAREEGRPADAVAELEAKWEALAQEFVDSGLTFTVKGLTVDERNAITGGATVDGVGLDETGCRLMQAAIVAPAVTVEQLKKITMQMGDAATMRLAGVINDASFNLAMLPSKP